MGMQYIMFVTLSDLAVNHAPCLAKINYLEGDSQLAHMLCR